MSYAVDLTSGQTGRHLIAAPFDSDRAATGWAEHFAQPRDTIPAETPAESAQNATSRTGALPATDWLARVFETGEGHP